MLALHGFTGDGADFAPLAPLWAGFAQRLDAPTLTGHAADPPRDPTAYRMTAVVEGLRTRLDRPVLGYSMGGRVALHLACRFPRRVPALVLIGATPGLEDPHERAARRAADHALASRIEEIGTARFIEAWSHVPIIASQRRIRSDWRAAMRARRVRRRPWGLAHCLRQMGTGAMAPVWDRLGTLRMPVLLITGAEDGKFTAIARRMLRLLPAGTHRVISDAGHCPHLERPHPTAAAISAWMRRHQGAR